MTRTPRSFAALALVATCGLSALAGCGGQNPFQTSESASTVVTVETSQNTSTEVEANVFLPAENLSSCVGTVERPNCGSASKGGWRMYVTFAVLMSGMGFIGWRIAKGIRAREAVITCVDGPTPDPASRVPGD